MDFAVVSEDYSRYLLKDGTTLKVKILVRKIMREGLITAQGYPINLGLDAANIVTAIVPPALKHNPSKEPWNPLTDVGTELKFEPIEEKWQEYITPDGYKIQVKPIVTKVIRYDKYNQFGEPIYNASVQTIVNIERFTSTATQHSGSVPGPKL
ncbi:MAG TPA: hypothetical protein VE955_07255 [Candidatus Dormibacteraeota bacterium]|jgi:hypothetical protein|nr:hypothetical protein [Candidatus Dormibacteraeota bacterium]